MSIKNLSQRANSRGVALIVGLIFLIVLTIFVLGGLRDVLLQERMAGAFRNNSLAQSAVDSLMKNAEVRIFQEVNQAGLNFSRISSQQLDNESTLGSTDTRNFRNGIGFVTNAAAVTPVLTSSPTYLLNSGDPTSTRSSPGAYILEGPFEILAPNSGGAEVESHGGVVTAGKEGELNGWRITVRGTGGTNDYVEVAEATYVIGN